MKKIVLFTLILIAGTIQAGEEVAEPTAQEAEQRLSAFGTLATEEFRRLLAVEGVNCDVANKNGMTLLMQQISRKHTTSNDGAKPIYARNIQELLNRGASLNATSFNGYTPFMWAAENRDSETIGLLMNTLQEYDYDEAAAILAMTSGANQTAVDLAGDNEEIVSMLTLPANVKSARKR